MIVDTNDNSGSITYNDNGVRNINLNNIIIKDDSGNRIDDIDINSYNDNNSSILGSCCCIDSCDRLILKVILILTLTVLVVLMIIVIISMIIIVLFRV